MPATWKDAKSVFYWINAIGRELNFPFSKSQEEKNRLYKDLYPKIIADAVHSDFESEMEDFLDHGAFGNIRFRFEDYFGFKNEVKNFFIQWTVQHYKIPKLPLRSYFLMQRSIDAISIKKEKEKIIFSLQDDKDKFPIILRFSPKQIFLLRPFLEANNIHPNLLDDSFEALAKALRGCKYHVLKYMHAFDHNKNTPQYWTYSLLSHDPNILESSFWNSVDGGFLPHFHPEDIPKPSVYLSSKYYTRGIKKIQSRTNGHGNLFAHYEQGNIVLSIKGSLLGFIQNNRFEWLSAPRPELIPYIESMFPPSQESDSISNITTS